MAVAFAAALVLCTSDPRLPAAISDYDQGNFVQARDGLLAVASDTTAPEADRADARIFLAASYLELGDPATARLQLALLVEEFPRARPDAARFVPALVAMHREELTKAGLPYELPKDESVAEPPPQPKAEVVQEGPRRGNLSRKIGGGAALAVAAAAVAFGAFELSLRGRSLANRSTAEAEAKSRYDAEISRYTARGISSLTVAAAAAGVGAWLLLFGPAAAPANRAAGTLMFTPLREGAGLVWTQPVRL